ncbi:MAG: sigma-70 family RNA polymerase sigma factor [Bacteroidota bacterium]
MIRTLKQATYNQADIVRGLRKGQQWAQLAFYDLYFEPAYHAAYRISRNQMDAEDAVHEGFIKAFAKINTLKKESAAESWLKRIIINETLHTLKSSRLFIQLAEDEEEVPKEETENDLPTLKELNACINELPEGYRIICQLFFIEEMKHEEIGQALGIAASTSRSQLSRAKVHLQKVIRQNLKKYEREL